MGGGGGEHWLCYKRLSATHCCNIKRNFYGYRNLQSLIFTALSAEVVAILQVNLKSSHWNTQWYYDELVFGQPKKTWKKYWDWYIPCNSLRGIGQLLVAADHRRRLHCTAQVPAEVVVICQLVGRARGQVGWVR